MREREGAAIVREALYGDLDTLAPLGMWELADVLRHVQAELDARWPGWRER